MIRNVKDLYKYFLNLINKEKTHVIEPELFNMIINAALLNWVKEKLPLNEFKQIRIEDLNVLLVDGGLGDGIKCSDDSPYVFPVPNESLYNIRVVFDVEYKDSLCFEDGLGKKKMAKLIKLDRLSSSSDNYYLKPKDDRLYFNYSNNNVRLFTGEYSGESKTEGVKMYLDYYKYPNTIEYSHTDSDLDDLQFKSLQLQEVAEQAAQEFLERNRDPRYQSYLNEQVQRNRI